ncbi:unnamed protein product [Chrysoparadoxa australica]
MAPSDMFPAHLRNAARQTQEQEKAEEVKASLDSSRPKGLPKLTPIELRQLRNGERVQRQTRRGGNGSGLVVVDVRADTDTVTGALLDYSRYAEMIGTVREARLLEVQEHTTKAEFCLSRFRLRLRVVLSNGTLDNNIVTFQLDPDCTKVGKGLFKQASGYWFVEALDERPGYSRVWMKADVETGPLLPPFIVDYAAARALPRASTWLKPQCEGRQRRKSIS